MPRSLLRVCTQQLLRFALVLGACPFTPVAAQGLRVVEKARWCYPGRTKRTCDVVLLTELGWSRALATTTFQRRPPSDLLATADVENDMNLQMNAQFGALINHGERTAVGATVLFAATAGGGADFGILGRYRRWHGSNGLSIDVSTGYIRGALEGPSGRVRARGATAEVALNVDDFGAVLLRTDVLRHKDRTASALFGGARIGSRPAAVVGATMAVLWVVVFRDYVRSP